MINKLGQNKLSTWKNLNIKTHNVNKMISTISDRSHFPRQLIIDVHSYCNASCVICPYDTLKKKLPMGVMDEDLFRKIIDDFSGIAKKHNFCGKVLFCNMGEFFLYPETTIERMRYVLAAGLEFNIQTNGSLMVPKQIDRLLAAGFKGSFTISCHGISLGVHDKIMGVDTERSLANIDYLLAHYPHERIGIQSIPYRWPFGETRRTRRHWRQRGVRVRMPLPNDRGGLVAPLSQRKRHATLLGCSANRPLGEMIISFNGDVPLCCNDLPQKR
ncbi:MAG: radical SAM protein [Phycisphaerae bacterium]